MDAKRWRNNPAFLLILSVLAMTLASCASMNATSSGSAAGSAADASSPTLYRDFDDILLPSDMKIDPKRTYLVEGSGMTTGVLTIKGWVDRNSLIDYFKSAMPRDQWQELASFKSPTADTNSIIVFQKAGRTAVVSVHEGWIYTYVEVAVAPTSPGISSDLLRGAGAQ